MKKLIYPCLSLFILLGCKGKDDDSTPSTPKTESTDLSSSQDYTTIDGDFEDVGNFTNEILEDISVGFEDASSKRSARLSDDQCYSIDHDATLKKITVTFDPEKLCDDLRARTGKWEITYTKPMRETGAVITTKLIGYSVDSAAVEGTRTVTNSGKNSNGKWTFNIVVSDGKRTKKGKVITWASTRKRVWENGDDTPKNFQDDIYLVSGTGSGISTIGKKFNIEVKEDEAIKLDLGCYLTKRLPVAGKLSLTPENESVRTINYGDGTCDGKFTLEVNGVTFQIGVN